MDKKIIVSLAIAFFIIFPSLVLHFMSPKTNPVEEKELMKKECQNLGEKERDICFLNLAKEKDTTIYCTNIENHILEGACMKSLWKREDCSYEIFSEEDVDDCYFHLAISSTNISFCSFISLDPIKKECASFMGTLSYKQQLPLLCKNNLGCYDTYTKLNNSCNIFKDQNLMWFNESEKAAHLNSCILRQASRSNDPSICNQLPSDTIPCYVSTNKSDEEILEFCSELATINPNEEPILQLDSIQINFPDQLINKITTSNFDEAKNYLFFTCIFFPAISISPKLCEHLPYIDQTEEFYMNLGVSDISSLFRRGKSSCYLIKSLLENNKSSCNNISDMALRSVCKSKILNSCETIITPKEKDLCNSLIGDEEKCRSSLEGDYMHTCLDVARSLIFN